MSRRAVVSKAEGDEIARMVLELVRGVAAVLQVDADELPAGLDRVRAYCPPEARYDYEGPTPPPVTSSRPHLYVVA